MLSSAFDENQRSIYMATYIPKSHMPATSNHLQYSIPVKACGSILALELLLGLIIVVCTLHDSKLQCLSNRPNNSLESYERYTPARPG